MNDTLGGRVRRLRERDALTQRELAERTGLSRDAIVQLEADRRRPRPSTIRVLARVLGVKPQLLTVGDGSQPEQG